MKMVKSLLLGTAAGLLAVAGAQAADMPVKAKPVQYVKICSLYGDGFYYMPGTDICIKIGGYVRAQLYWGDGSSSTSTPFFTPNFWQTRTPGQGADLTFRARTIVTVDTRQQTEWGTLRTYLNIGHSGDSPGATAIYANRAFIQFAGFTMGLASSFFDLYSSPSVSYHALNTEDTGDGGWKVFAFTAQFGNGVTSTVSLEEPRRTTVVNTAFGASVTNAISTTAAGVTAVQGTFNNPFLVGAIGVPDQVIERNLDIVWNWRIDQAWGAAMIAGAVHDNSGGYYGTTITGALLNGHPADKLGWVASAGLRLNTVNGSYFQTQASVTQGALRYLSHTQFPLSSAALFGFGNSLGVGIITDGVYNTGSEVELTRGWAVYAAYDHVWAPMSRWKTSLYGGYIKISYNDNAKAMIAQATCGVQNPTPTTGVAAANVQLAGTIANVSNCNPDWALGYVGSRTQYNFTPDFYAGFDVIYTKLYTGFPGTATFRQATGQARPTGVYAIEDQDSWNFTIRFHRDFKP